MQAGAQQKQQASQQQALYGLAKGYKDYLSQNPQGGAQYYENFLRPSLALILVLVGVKMLLQNVVVVPTLASLAVVGLILAGGTAASLLVPVRGPRPR